MTRVIEMWCDKTTAIHEIGRAAKTLLNASREALIEDCPYVEGSKDYAPKKVTVTISDEEE